jgi:hypothetical protein
VKFLSAPNPQRTQLVRGCTAEAEAARKQIHRRGNPPPVAICETAALFTGGSQSQNEDDQQDQTEPAAGVVTPSGALWPRGKGTNQQQNHQQYCSHWDLPSDKTLE